MVQELLAKDYADKVIANLHNIIKSAYQEGYEAGVKSLTDNSITIDGVEYVDLALPSGTLWSKCTYRSLLFQETIGLSIPDCEQWKELKKYCKITNEGSTNGCTKVKILGMNGNSILYYVKGESRDLYSWIKQDSSPSRDKLAVDLTFQGTKYSNYFVGESLPVFLVKL